MRSSFVNTQSFIRSSYEQLLLYYYKNMGEVSEITGALITEDLVSTIERRYMELGGKPSVLKFKNSMPSVNGSIDSAD